MGRIAFLFTGQGAQYVGMGKDLYDNEPAAKAVFDMGEELRPGTLKQCFESDQEILTQTQNAQPCLFLMDLACARVLEAHGLKADIAAGFSLGEITATAYTQILTDEEAFKLVTLRGEKMAACAEENPGGMSAVIKLSAEQVTKLCKDYEDVFAVNYNCPGQTVVAGKKEQLAVFGEAVKEAGGRMISLAVSGAFHSPYMEQASDALSAYLTQLVVKAPRIPLIANTTGAPYPMHRNEICEVLAKQASRAVQWETTLHYLQENGVDTFIEVGAGKTLSGLVAKTLSDVKGYHVTDVETMQSVVEELAERRLYA